MTTLSHIEDWGAIPRDLTINDHSRTRATMAKGPRAAAELVTNLGNGLTQVTYVDSLMPPAASEG